MTHAFDFAGHRVEARPSGALFWPDRRWLIVADLHLGKSERLARRGGSLLPPYEVLATLDRLESEIAATDPAAVVSLGDGFDDDTAAQALPDMLCDRLRGMAWGRRWIWISGNHDPSPVCPRLPGETVAELADGLVLRHQAGQGPDVSGHFHPCVRLAGERRRCFLAGRDHLILPAFGAYTGGLAVDSPVLSALVPQGLAIACGGGRALALPVGTLRRTGRRA
ncbi:ligase-associated DNA damage response endonuclease PdeM [Paracoccus sediminis]|uniref:Ligase-associated DNA damage response endonuclease PdeM n=1 Tax=Paracoccus sediminis TaxID=1214787 RepID=A0A238VI87_9RHOB|nr:ligase-associated DNA damage response endonuclease PdeM [Paracoccus sediminis]TBN52135.1 ligase-associated DNA damage response endonuclease PdeM [Paracoccus sediminis]SNR33901.1 putative phosphoesterase [Paracoccus sediminis]